MNAQVKIWSEIGSTPITHRGGSFCDELASFQVDALNPADAKEYVKLAMKNTPYAATAHIAMPEWWNQNERSQWISK